MSDDVGNRVGLIIERAHAVAKELRARGIWAQAGLQQIAVVRVYGREVAEYNTRDERFALLAPNLIAAVIQEDEVTRAKEWAGDES
jgi:hypothetical protein